MRSGMRMMPYNVDLPDSMKSGVNLTREVAKRLVSREIICGRYVKELPGKPNMAIGQYTTAVFIWKCDYIMHDCKKASLSDTNSINRPNKIDNHIKKAERIVALLQKQGWNVITAYECQFSKDKIYETMKILLATLKSMPSRENGTSLRHPAHVELPFE